MSSSAATKTSRSPAVRGHPALRPAAPETSRTRRNSSQHLGTSTASLPAQSPAARGHPAPRSPGSTTTTSSSTSSSTATTPALPLRQLPARSRQHGDTQHYGQRHWRHPAPAAAAPTHRNTAQHTEHPAPLSPALPQHQHQPTSSTSGAQQPSTAVSCSTFPAPAVPPHRRPHGVPPPAPQRHVNRYRTTGPAT